MIDWIVSLWPLPVRGRPYLGLHVASPSYRHYAGERGSHRVYHVGVLWGRFFTDKSGGAFWFDVVMPWRARD